MVFNHWMGIRWRFRNLFHSAPPMPQTRSLRQITKARLSYHFRSGRQGKLRRVWSYPVSAVRKKMP